MLLPTQAQDGNKIMARISSLCLFFSSSFVVSDATKSILVAILQIIMIAGTQIVVKEKARSNNIAYRLFVLLHEVYCCLCVKLILLVAVSSRCGVSCFIAVLFTPLSIPTWIEEGSNFRSGI
ncbi:UNVERIFIED_CONTAM: hypothetical protein Sindi_1894900 [Sesamum indicum]